MTDNHADETGVTFLREIGFAVFGERWQMPLARHLGVSDRTMRRWSANPYLVPDTVLLELDSLATTRGVLLLRAHRMLLREVTQRMPQRPAKRPAGSL